MVMPELPLLPCVEPNDDPRPRTLGDSFAYDGRPIAPADFPAYLATYDFGTILPDQIVLHNTANPDASWAALDAKEETNWDRNELGLSLAAIQAKRKKQLDAIKSYYISLGWDAGPHLFIDDRWIWLFTPMAEVGVHAKEGNSYHDSTGKLHYTIGIEVVGWYGRVAWPPAIQVMVRSAVQALQKRLGTFQIRYQAAPLHRPDLHQGTIAFHYDYNKPECPGAQITPAWAISVLKQQPLRPNTRYMVKHTQAVFESPSPSGKIALSGTAELTAGTGVDIDEVAHGGWAHMANGLGFVPVGILEKM